MHTRKFVDLFAGCGGLSLGLSLAGMRGLFAIERDDMAFQTFSSNFVEDGAPPASRFEWPSWLEQRAWGIDEVLDQHKANLEQLRGTVDILAGGPPCQGFSFAGRRVEDDPRNLLFNKYVEAVEAIRPSALVLENVPGMQVAHRRGNVVSLQVEPQPRLQSFYEKLAVSLDAAGYEVDAVLADASRFGVPQKRSRLIAIGIRKDLALWLDNGVQRVFDLLEEARLGQLSELKLGEKCLPQTRSRTSKLVIGRWWNAPILSPHAAISRPLTERRPPLTRSSWVRAFLGLPTASGWRATVTMSVRDSRKSCSSVGEACE